MLLQSIFAFGAIIGFSVLIEAPKRCLVVNGILGMAGWAVYLYTERYTTTLIPSILTIVPGAGMYKTVYYLFTADTQEALSSLVLTIGAAGAIALAIFIVDAFVAVVKRLV